MLQQLMLLHAIVELDSKQLVCKYQIRAVDYLQQHPTRVEFLKRRFLLDDRNIWLDGATVINQKYAEIFVLDNTTYTEVVYQHELGHLYTPQIDADGKYAITHNDIKADEYAVIKTDLNSVIEAYQYQLRQFNIRLAHTLNPFARQELEQSKRFFAARIKHLCRVFNYHDTSYH